MSFFYFHFLRSYIFSPSHDQSRKCHIYDDYSHMSHLFDLFTLFLNFISTLHYVVFIVPEKTKSRKGTVDDSTRELMQSIKNAQK